MARKSEEKMAQKSKNNITKEILMRCMTWGKNEYLLGFDFCLAYSRTTTVTSQVFKFDRKKECNEPNFCCLEF